MIFLIVKKELRILSSGVQRNMNWEETDGPAALCPDSGMSSHTFLGHHSPEFFLLRSRRFSNISWTLRSDGHAVIRLAIFLSPTLNIFRLGGEVIGHS